MTTFDTLGLSPDLLKTVAAEGYSTPTPIQLQAIPPVLAGKDVLGIAQTGTGKTAAFALPILQRLAADKRQPDRRCARCLILAPTRELASQIADMFRTYGKGTGMTVGTVYGGVGHRPQMQMMARGVDVLVATPGRLLDHMGEGNIDLSRTEILVLDEADQMMDLGFIRPLRQIIGKLPKNRQTLFFSATMPHEIGALAAEMLRDPVKVAVTPIAKTADRVRQHVILVEAGRKRALLAELFADPALSRALVFTRTKRGADKVARHLEEYGVPVAAIHGNKSQGQREQALAAFKGARIRALVATDIAARGIDVDDVSHVINFELPNIPESYVHRIGRTARAGAEGIAISLCDGEERAYLRDIERLTRQSIPVQDRRGDTTLVVEDRSRERGEPRRPEGRSHRGGPERSHRNGASRSGHAPAARSAHPRDARSAHPRDAHSGAGEDRRAVYDPMRTARTETRGPHEARNDNPRARHEASDGAKLHRTEAEPRREGHRGEGHSASAGPGARSAGPSEGHGGPRPHANRSEHSARPKSAPKTVTNENAHATHAGRNRAAEPQRTVAGQRSEEPRRGSSGASEGGSGLHTVGFLNGRPSGASKRTGNQPRSRAAGERSRDRRG